MALTKDEVFLERTENRATVVEAVRQLHQELGMTPEDLADMLYQAAWLLKNGRL